MKNLEVLYEPIVSEKMTKLGDKLNRYAFLVRKKANKLEIKKAVEKMYGVSVKAVNTAVLPGKAKSRNTKSGVVSGQTSSYKKAIITLASSDKIDFFSNI